MLISNNPVITKSLRNCLTQGAKAPLQQTFVALCLLSWQQSFGFPLENHSTPSFSSLVSDALESSFVLLWSHMTLALALPINSGSPRPQWFTGHGTLLKHSGKNCCLSTGAPSWWEAGMELPEDEVNKKEEIGEMEREREIPNDVIWAPGFTHVWRSTWTT